MLELLYFAFSNLTSLTSSDDLGGETIPIDFHGKKNALDKTAVVL